MCLSLLTKLFIYLIGINITLQKQYFKNSILTVPRGDNWETFAENQTFVKGEDSRAFYDVTRTTKPEKVTLSTISKNKIDECDSEDQENDSLNATNTDSQYFVEPPFKRADWTPSCQYQGSRYITVSRPCPWTYSTSIYVNYQCGISCVENGGNTACEISNCEGRFICDDGTYISLSSLCDGSKDCAYNEDEINCAELKTDYCTCVGITIDCNHGSSLGYIQPFGIDSVRSDLANFTEINRTLISYLNIDHCSGNQVASVVNICQDVDCSGLWQVDISNTNFTIGLPEHQIFISKLSELRVLRLTESRIPSLPEGVFCKLPISYLDLSSNNISSLPVGVFRGLPLDHLDLSSNSISSLPVGIFKGLPLSYLDLSSNRITSLQPGIFHGLQTLERLMLSFNMISSLPVNIFDQHFLYDLNLSFNMIESLPVGIFNGLPYLNSLTLFSNRISSLPVGVFTGMQYLSFLSLSSNMIPSLPVGVFNGLSNLQVLYISFNMIPSLSVGVFDGLPLDTLSLSFNNLSYIPDGVFSRLPLYVLDLSSNRLSSLSSGVFSGLVYAKPDNPSFMKVWLREGVSNGLRFINLSSNILASFPVNVFNNLSLNVLDLSSNKVSSLDRGVCTGLRTKFLSLASNGMVHISDGSFEGVVKLLILNLVQNKLQVTELMFEGLHNLTHLFVDTYMICCVKPKSVPYENCLGTNDNPSCIKIFDRADISSKTCSAPTTAISTCTSVIGSLVLRILLWLIGLAALVGNIAVIVYRLIDDKENLKKSYSIFVLNLSLSDVLMGVYLLIIGAADVHYRGVYAWNDQRWRRSTLCITAGILSTISSEMSTFVILMISIDRFVVIVFPFTQHKITWRQASCVCIALWVVAFILAMIPQVTLHSYFKSGFYSKSGVCLALPLTGDTDGAEYSMSVFVGLNSCIFLVIMLGHIGMYKSVTSANIANTQTRRRDIAVAKTLFLVVATDFCCWIPIGILGILAQIGIQTPNSIYSWVMIFVLPINSAINPFIYTFMSVRRKRRGQKQTSRRESSTLVTSV